MKRIRMIMAVAALLLGGIGTVALPTSVATADTSKQTVCQTLGAGNDCTSNTNGLSLSRAIKAVVTILSIVVGVTAVIMIIVGGFRYITSGGDSNNTASARKTITYALVGLIVVAMAQFIVRFVLDAVSK